MALNGKIPFVYSITTFLLYRPFETIRNYINHEKIPVKLIGGGRDRDYSHDGFSHWAEEDKKVLKIFNNIKALWPENKEKIPGIVDKMVKDNNPWYLNLKR
jgi:transketolase